VRLWEDPPWLTLAHPKAARAPGGGTLGPGEGEPGADFTLLGLDVKFFSSRLELGQLVAAIDVHSARAWSYPSLFHLSQDHAGLPSTRDGI
jgi:hypothetical protein